MNISIHKRVTRRANVITRRAKIRIADCVIDEGKYNTIVLNDTLSIHAVRHVHLSVKTDRRKIPFCDVGLTPEMNQRPCNILTLASFTDIQAER